MANFELTKHCSLCDNQVVDFNIGTTCSLTNQKPDFNESCPKIVLGDKFWESLKTLNIQQQLLLNAKTITYLNAGVFAVIGIAIIYGGYYFGSMIWDAGFISTVPLTIVGVGLLVTSYSLAPIRTFSNKLSIAKEKKDRMDGVLKLYGIEYDIKLKVEKEIHGSHDIRMELKIKGLDKNLPNVTKTISENLRYDTDDVMHSSPF
ncbi:MAG: hypothetical protein H6601_03220 [Flavobacteriales bacterium]|nr:hypothetical protein [Flavobacteriales bacterium]